MKLPDAQIELSLVFPIDNQTTESIFVQIHRPERQGGLEEWDASTLR